MGLWSVWVQRRMVSDPVAKRVGKVPHCCQGPGSGGHAMGAPWQSTMVLVRSDKAAVVDALTSGTAGDPVLMHLLRCPHFFLAHYDIRLLARHIAGIK